jgi:hypothetical protein
VVFKGFTEVEAEFFRLFYQLFVNVQNKIVFVSQAYSHPKDCIGIFSVICLVILELIRNKQHK